MAWLYKQKASRNWWIGYRINGKPFFKSTGTPDKDAAKEQLATVELMFTKQKTGALTEELFQQLTGKAVARVTLKTALDSWLDESRGSTSPKTVDKYNQLAREFGSYMNATAEKPLLANVTTEEVREFLTRKRSVATAATVNGARKILSSFFIREVKNGRLRANPVLPIKVFKAGRGEVQRRRAFTTNQLRLMFQKAPDDFWRYMILAGTYTGQRLGDLIQIPWGAIDFGQNVIRLIQGKTENRVEIPMAAPLRALLWQLRTKAGKVAPDAYVWPAQAKTYQEKGSGQFSNEFYATVLVPCGLAKPRSHQSQGKGRGAARDGGGPSFHCFRHTFISLLKATGGNQAVAKELAGHSSDMVNDLYTHMPADALAHAIKQLPEVVK